MVSAAPMIWGGWSPKVAWDPPTGELSLEGHRPSEENPHTHSDRVLWCAGGPPIPPCLHAHAVKEMKRSGSEERNPPRSFSWLGTVLGSGF